jgi:phage terminase large subunit-like protein
MKIIPIHTHQGKLTRAEGLSVLYHQNKVFHTDIFKQLENQMCSFTVNYTKSPDRLDALGLAITELMFPTAQPQRPPTIRYR